MSKNDERPPSRAAGSMAAVAILVLGIGFSVWRARQDERASAAARDVAAHTNVLAAYERWAAERADEARQRLPAKAQEDVEDLRSFPAEARVADTAVLVDRARLRIQFSNWIDAWLAGDAARLDASGVRLSAKMQRQRASQELGELRARLRRRLSSTGPKSFGSSPDDPERVSVEFWVVDWFDGGYEHLEGRFEWTPETEWVLDDVDAWPITPPRDSKPPDTSTVVPSLAGSDPAKPQHQTCQLCRAIRHGKPGDEWTVVVADGACSHEWRDGASHGLRSTQRDGAVVLVRRGDEFGAFRLERQLAEPDRVTYTWIVRDDGGTVLDASGPATKHGRVADAQHITLGTMTVKWSVAENGSGWLYLARLPGTEPSERDVLLCVTDLADWAGVDAADGRWEYLAALGEAPRTGR